MFATVVPNEMLIVGLIIIVLFGAKKLPEIGKGLGQGIKEFKSATTKGAEADEDVPPSAQPPAPPNEPTA